MKNIDQIVNFSAHPINSSKQYLLNYKEQLLKKESLKTTLEESVFILDFSKKQFLTTKDPVELIISIFLIIYNGISI